MITIWEKNEREKIAADMERTLADEEAKRTGNNDTEQSADPIEEIERQIEEQLQKEADEEGLGSNRDQELNVILLNAYKLKALA